MKILTGRVTDDVTSETSLAAQALAYPQINKDLIRLECNELNLWLVNYCFGYGRTISDPKTLPNGGGKVSRNQMSWFRQGRARVPLTVGTIIPSGSGASHAAITFYVVESWVQPGMVLNFQDGLGGNVNIIVTTQPTYSAPNWTFSGVIMGESVATFNPALAPIGGPITWLGAATAACGNYTTEIPVIYPDEFTNYTSTFSVTQTVCETGLQTPVWVELVPGGERAWIPQQERDARTNILKTVEGMGWNANTTMQSGTSTTPDGNGNFIVQGSGVFEQVQASYIATYNIAQAIAPATQAAFVAFVKNQIENWAINNAITSSSIELNMIAATKAMSMIQDALKANVVNDGGERVLHDYEGGASDTVKIGYAISQYRWAGFIINLQKCAAWDDIGQSALPYLTTTVPLTSYRFIVMPDTLPDGQPPIQVYLKDGNGVQTGFVTKVIPGTVDPYNRTNYMAVNTFRGYQVFHNSEYMFVVPDPSKILVFNGV